jgi:hypothetical protein
MSEDLRASLAEIAVGAARDLRPVPLEGLRRRVRRRRAVRRTAGVTAALLAATSVGAAAVALGAVPSPAPVLPAQPTASASASPSPSAAPTTTTAPTTPVAGWVPGAEPCGTTPTITPHDSDTVEIQGTVVPGTFDVPTALFRAGEGDSTLYRDVQVTTEHPGLPAGDGAPDLRVMLVDDAGTVVFWDDPARQLPQIESSTHPGSFSTYGLYPAQDCRTGQPLSGTFRVIASDADETVELAPVALGADFDAEAAARATDQATRRYQDLPVCGAPLPEAWRRAAADPDLVVSFGTAGPPAQVGGAGLHAAVTVTASDEALSGLVPQALAAVLVDDAGTVVTGPFPASSGGGALTGTPYDVGPGASFASEVFQWWTGCPEPPYAQPGAGEYDLYVLDTVPATGADGSVALRTVAGGPFRVAFDPAG